MSTIFLSDTFSSDGQANFNKEGFDNVSYKNASHHSLPKDNLPNVDLTKKEIPKGVINKAHDNSLKKMILLDRDKTLNHDPGYLKDSDALRLLPSVGEGLRLLKNLGFFFVVVTNQSGIGRGYFSKEDLQAVHQRLDELLQAEGVSIADYFVCPHVPQTNCSCRKPKPALVQQALQKYNVLPQNAYVIGDRLRDIAAAEYADIKGILLSDSAEPTENIADAEVEKTPSNLLYVAKDLQEAAAFIAQHDFDSCMEQKIFPLQQLPKNKKNEKNEKENSEKNKIPNRQKASTKFSQNLQNFLSEQAASQKKIIFTNGCFDVLHPGHIQYLWQAARLGDVLVIGLNSDSSVKRLKGEKRPVNGWQDRALLLASLTSVSAVVEFDEDTPENLLASVRPHVHVKGGDYKAKDLPEYALLKDMGAEVIILPFRQGYSTTSFLQRIH